jgi:hypothetical protein
MITGLDDCSGWLSIICRMGHPQSLLNFGIGREQGGEPKKWGWAQKNKAPNSLCVWRFKVYQLR